MNSVIIEKFTTESVVPNEEILCWIKYAENSNFDSIKLSYIEDNKIIDFQFKNIKKDVSSKKEEKKKIVNLLRDEFTLDGFFCFTCKYSYLEIGKQTLSFFIELQLNGNTIDSTILNIYVIRPILEVGEEKIKSLFISSSIESEFKPIKYEIYNRGSVNAVDLKLRFKVSHNNINLLITPYTRNKIVRGFFKQNIPVHDVLLQTSGIGEAMVQVIAEYYDYQGNFYKDILETFSTVSNTKEKIEITLLEQSI